MRRAPEPDIVIPSTELKVDDNLISQEREYELITPLFGGGFEPGECDKLTPIRGTEIRGHLRFWWRATRGGQFGGNLKSMKQREDEIWGAASTEDVPAPSKVRVGVTQSVQPGVAREDRANLDSPFEVRPGRRGQAKVEPRDGSRVPAYIAFPLQPTAEEALEILRTGKPTRTVCLNVGFTLKVSFFAEDRLEVEAALWGWETFGGIGARTRRGFGALTLQRIEENGLERPLDLPASTAVVKPWVQKKLKDFGVMGKWPEHVSRLPDISRFKFTNAAVSGRSTGTTRSLEVLEYFAKKLMAFRQSRYNRNLGISRDDKFGLSRWPEAEEIRRRSSLSSRNPELRGINKFPRAKLGLPIIFHLPHDGVEVELKGATSNRRASPLIFRPLVCADSDVLGVAVILSPESLPPDVLILKGVVGAPEPIDVEPGGDLFRIKPLRNERDIFKAFLNTL